MNVRKLYVNNHLQKDNLQIYILKDKKSTPQCYVLKIFSFFKENVFEEKEKKRDSYNLYETTKKKKRRISKNEI